MNCLLAEGSEYKVSFQHKVVWYVETLMGEDLLII